MIDKLKELLAITLDDSKPAREIFRAEYEIMKLLPSVIERLACLEEFHRASMTERSTQVFKISTDR